MGFSIPLPSTHSHHHKQHSVSKSSDHSPSPGHLPHASTLPATLDGSNHKHYHNKDQHHSSSPFSRIPNVNPSTYLSKHEREYQTQHTFRHAKRDASVSSDSHPMPSLEYSKTSSSDAVNEEAVLSESRKAELEEQRRKQTEEDNASWAAIMQAREAASRRSMIDRDLLDRPHPEEYQKMSEGSIRTANSRD